MIEILTGLSHEEWLEARKGSVGGTQAAKLCCRPIHYAPLPPDVREAHMARGREMEPRIVEAINEMIAPARSLTGTLYRWPSQRYHYSPDGLIGGSLLEIKSPAKRCPSSPYDSHVWQVRWGMMIMGLEDAWIYYCAGTPKRILAKSLAGYQVLRDKSLENKMRERADNYLRHLSEEISQ